MVATGNIPRMILVIISLNNYSWKYDGSRGKYPSNDINNYGHNPLEIIMILIIMVATGNTPNIILIIMALAHSVHDIIIDIVMEGNSCDHPIIF